ERFSSAYEVGICRSMKHEIVVDPGHPFICRRADGPWQQVAAPDIGFDIATEKVLLEIGEDLVPMEPVIRRREAAARYGGNHVDFIEQSSLLTVQRNVEVAQSLEYAICECRGALAAA